MKIVLFRDARRQWRFRVVAGNHKMLRQCYLCGVVEK
jgi:uncharacterized protein YegP (UPF0339 family)